MPYFFKIHLNLFSSIMREEKNPEEINFFFSSVLDFYFLNNKILSFFSKYFE